MVRGACPVGRAFPFAIKISVERRLRRYRW